MNIVDRLILPFAPKAVATRMRYRSIVAAYEATKPTRTRKNKADNSSGDAVAEVSLHDLRGQARHLDQNHDFSSGILNVLTQNVIGPRGIGVEPQPRTLSGEIDVDFAQELEAGYAEFCKRPDITREMSGCKGDRLLCRTWLRDGEALMRHHEGNIAGLKHSTKVPYSVEYLEPDYLPENLNDKSRRIVQGVQVGAWGEPTHFHLYRDHPGGTLGFRTQTRAIPANEISRVRFIQRLHQQRGVSIFATVLNRLSDIKDYEEAERVAARMAAAMVAYVKRGNNELYEAPIDGEGNFVKPERSLSFAPGMIWDNLEPGEEVGTIESNRPSPLLQPFLETMQRMAATGTMTSFSSVSKNYNGTYAAQRQELVEQWGAYETLSWEFIDEIKSPQYGRYIRMAVLSGVIKVPDTLDRAFLFDADYIIPVMPWIDPKKEADSNTTLKGQLLESPQRIIRKRGAKPKDILDQLERWNTEINKRGLQVQVPGESSSSKPDDDDDSNNDNKDN